MNGWDKTTASECRYGDLVGEVLGPGRLVAEQAEADYQGYASVVWRRVGGKFVVYEWTYGSCSGCDDWEARGLSDEAIKDEIREGISILSDEVALRRYFGISPDPDVALADAPCDKDGDDLGWGFSRASLRRAVFEWLRDFGGGKAELAEEVVSRRYLLVIKHGRHHGYVHLLELLKAHHFVNAEEQHPDKMRLEDLTIIEAWGAEADVVRWFAEDCSAPAPDGSLLWYRELPAFEPDKED